MAGIQYGTENPRAIEPFSIESTLAPLAVGGNANAQTLLQQYHLQNQVAQDQYLSNLADQHEVARQQIAAQMAEARMKEAPNWAKAPGLARLMYSQGFFPGLSADDVSPSVGQAETAIAATNLKDFGQGANQLSQGGYQFADPNAVPGSPGGIATNLGPAMVQSEKIKAAVDMARIAASNSGAPKESATSPPDPSAGGMTFSTSFPRGWTAQQQRDWLVKQGRIPGGSTSLQPNPNASSGTVQTNAGPLPKAQADTPAPQAPPSPDTQTASTAPAAPASQGGNAAVLGKVRDMIEQNRGAMPPAMYGDLKKGMDMNGGNPIVKQGPDGRQHVYGASGKAYN